MTNLEKFTPEWDAYVLDIHYRLSETWEKVRIDNTVENNDAHRVVVRELDEAYKDVGYDKATYRILQTAWQRFDATTAYGCANKGVLYDNQRCLDAWKAYNSVLSNMGVAPVGESPIGLTSSAQ